jgi:hypothetical protein
LGPIFAFLNFTLMYTIALAIGGITGAVFPYLKKTKPLYERSPIAHLRIGGIPLVTILGILTFISMSYLAYAAGLNPVIGGTNNPVALGVLLMVFIGSGALYFIALAYHKSKGLDISIAFHDLPPE